MQTNSGPVEVELRQTVCLELEVLTHARCLELDSRL